MEKFKIIAYYNNGFFDILIGGEFFKEIGYGAEEAFDSLVPKLKNGWIYEVVVGNLVRNKEQHGYYAEQWTDFDVLKYTPIRYVSKYTKTQTELRAEEELKLKTYLQEIKNLVKW